MSLVHRGPPSLSACSVPGLITVAATNQISAFETEKKMLRDHIAILELEIRQLTIIANGSVGSSAKGGFRLPASAKSSRCCIPEQFLKPHPGHRLLGLQSLSNLYSEKSGSPPSN
ncbi:hypothetical protein B0H13DRAFT_1879752 [Mycena leptocephala]|nr:hypothetical protein B0H13DRAFT_1879752 [Mycena leptocephala]